MPGHILSRGGHSYLRRVTPLVNRTLKTRPKWTLSRRYELLAALPDQNIEAVAVEFDGEDPAIPELRHVLTHSHEKLIDLHEETQRYTGPFELVEPDEEELAWVREIMEREPP